MFYPQIAKFYIPLGMCTIFAKRSRKAGTISKGEGEGVFNMRRNFPTQNGFEIC